MRIIVGISGASGVEMGWRLLEGLRHQETVETHLVVTKGAKCTFEYETGLDIAEVERCADFAYSEDDMAAKISSGSFTTDGMVVIPCSMKTLSNIACGNAGNLLVRAADVCLKEGRKVVLVPREMPFSRLHIRNLAMAAELGCVIIPPMLTFYNGARTVEAQVDHIIGKIFMQFGLEYDKFVPWEGIPGD